MAKLIEKFENNQYKKRAAIQAVQFVQDGMVVGLGTGSTATFAIDALGERVAQGLQIKAIPTSEKSRERALAKGIEMVDFSAFQQLDITIDGADEVEVGSLNLIKGLGGALLREKIVASVSKKLVIIVDETKLVSKLGSKCPVPVEVVPFGWELTNKQLSCLGASSKLRLDESGCPFITDGGHYILDCWFSLIDNTKELCDKIKRLIGVVESGLFIELASSVVVAGPLGVKIIEP